MSLSHDFIPFSLAFSHLSSSQTYKSTYESFLVSTFLPPSLTLLFLLPHSRSPISPPLSSLLLFSPFLVFSSFFYFFSSYFFPSSFFFSSFFIYFCHSNFSCFSLYCLPYFSRHLVIFTTPILQSISELWHASYNIPKIILHFCLPIIYSL